MTRPRPSQDWLTRAESAVRRALEAEQQEGCDREVVLALMRRSAELAGTAPQRDRGVPVAATRPSWASPLRGCIRTCGSRAALALACTVIAVVLTAAAHAWTSSPNRDVVLPSLPGPALASPPGEERHDPPRPPATGSASAQPTAAAAREPVRPVLPPAPHRAASARPSSGPRPARPGPTPSPVQGEGANPGAPSASPSGSTPTGGPPTTTAAPPSPPVPPPPPGATPTVRLKHVPGGGLSWRDTLDQGDPAQVPGFGVRPDERIQLECYVFGATEPTTGGVVWYLANNVSRPYTPRGRPNTGWIDAYYVVDGSPPGSPARGVAPC